MSKSRAICCWFIQITPSFELILKIAYALEITPADLFVRDSSKNEREIRSHIEHILSKGLKELLDKEFSAESAG